MKKVDACSKQNLNLKRTNVHTREIQVTSCPVTPCPPNSLIEACQSKRHTLDLKCANVVFLMNLMPMR
jgi:hypothetical protein